ncbi:FAD-dependent oxidoreductase [Arthrobacter sp. C152]
MDDAALTQALRWVALTNGDWAVDFGFAVAGITDDGGAVTVRSADGRALRARAAIVTVPLHAMAPIDFEPPLEAAKAEGAALGQADWPLNFFQAEYTLDGDTIVVGFGPDASTIDASDAAAVQAQLARLVPGVEVLDVATHDWVADPLAGETWPMHRTGFLSRHLAAMQSAHGNVFFAGSDTANGWGGFIDGAIESGMEAALDAAALLAGRRNALR